MPTDARKLLTTGEAAKLCAVTPDTILKWIKKGRLGGVRTAGGHYRIERQTLEPLIASPAQAGGPSQPPSDRHPQTLRCWEYLSDRGAVRDSCRQCVVFRVRAGRCFLMAGLEPDVGHARQFCQSSCEDCVYYRRVKGLATNVLLISADDELIDRLGNEEHEAITLRFARNGYDASAMIEGFRPAFVAIDLESIPDGNKGLFESLAADPRIPGLRVILVLPPGVRGQKLRPPTNDLVVSVVTKPFSTRQIADLVSGLSVDSLTLEDSTPQVATRREQL
jgi:excisionase family DNA binding protein